MPETKPSIFESLYDDIGESASIRLLLFVPGVHHGNIELSMRTFCIDNYPPYIALSYTWEPRFPLQDIKLNGQNFRVGKNLYHFLQIKSQDDAFIARPPSSFDTIDWDESAEGDATHWDHTKRHEYMNNPSLWKFFWIDQISVNQHNLAERGHQVKLMASIYSNAVFVLSWMGHIDGSIVSEPVVAAPWQSRQNRRDSKLILEFAASPYWTRLWVVQEIILAKEILICNNVCSIIWRNGDEISLLVHGEGAGFSSLHPRNTAKSTNKSKDNYMRNLMVVRSYLHDEGVEKYRILGQRLEFLIRSFKNQKCVDPRDTVFGLLSLVGSRYVSITPDYNRSAEEVYADVIRATYPVFLDAERDVIIDRRRVKNEDSSMIVTRSDWNDFKISLLQGLRLSHSDRLEEEEGPTKWYEN